MIFVDGAAGFVGRALVERLSAQGLRVRATDRPGTELPDLPGVECVHAELGSADWASLLAGVDAGAHVAGLFDLSATERALHQANVVLARRAAEAAAEAGVRRWVHVSSVTVLGRPTRSPAREDDPGKPGSAYERTKAQGEAAVMELAQQGRLAVTALRPSGIYGPRGRYGLAMMAATSALAAKSGKGHRSLRGGTRMTHVHVDDVAAAATLLLDAAHSDARVVGRAFHVADETPATWGEVAQVIERFYALPEHAPIVMTPWRARLMSFAARLMPGRLAKTNASLARRWAALVQREGLVPALTPRIDADAWSYWRADHVYDTSALRALGFRAAHPDVRVGLEQTLRSYVDAGWLPAP